MRFGSSALPWVGSIGLFFVAGSAASAQSVERVTLGHQGQQSSSGGVLGGMSSDGRFVTFNSAEANLVPSDVNGFYDVFLRDRGAQTTTLVSLDSFGQQFAFDSLLAQVSSNGRYVAFAVYQFFPFRGEAYRRDVLTGATVQVSPSPLAYGVTGMSGDGNRVAMYGYQSFGQYTQAHVRDATAGALLTVNGSQPGPPAGGTEVGRPVLSGNGQYAFYWYSAWDGYGQWSWTQTRRADLGTSAFLVIHPSRAQPLGSSADGRYVLLHENPTTLWIRDVSAGVDWPLPLAGGALPLAATSSGSMSDDGRFAAFVTASSNIVPGDTNGIADVFVWDRVGQVIARVGLGLGGAEPNGQAQNVFLSGDASLVAFTSAASNLVAGDTNNASDGFVVSTCMVHFADLDADGFGAGPPQVVSCPPPPGYVGSGDDCDDTDPLIHPGAVESCNGLDDDCDGSVDEGLLATWYADGDSDGYGNSGAALLTCNPPGGYVLVGGDCDDMNPAIHPGASDPCNGVDDDCDGNVDTGSEGAPYCTAGTTSNGCVPVMSATGVLRASVVSGYVLQVSEVEGQRLGLILYGFAPASMPWAPFSTSLLCVAAPRQRTSTSSTHGMAGFCDGVLTIDARAWMASNPNALGQPLSPGQALYFQGWFRDPQAPKGSNLSGGWSTNVCP